MRIKYDVKFNRMYPRRIRLDAYTVYCNARTATYSLYALGTTVPRQSEELTDIIKILHSLCTISTRLCRDPGEARLLECCIIDTGEVFMHDRQD